MAELPKNIRRPGGDLVSARQPFGRRVLLPTEADLCNLLGITEEEYWQFVEQVAAKSKERPKGYEHIPDIRSGPLLVYNAAGAAVGLSFLGQIVVGVALSVIAYLLTPKPDTRQGSNRRTADIGGTRRFAPQFGFNSVQDLANLGDIIPLVFANYETYEETTEDGIKTKHYGGVRINSQLLWSQIISLGRYQQLKILAMFSLGELAEDPDFKGYAIGDLLLHNYNDKKINLTNDNIPFIRKGSKINKQKFKIDNQEWFSGTRNPTTQAVFGLSNPIPNATYFRLPYELLRISPDLNDDTVPPARQTLAKRRKNLGKWPARAGFIKIENIGSANAAQVKLGNQDIPKDAKIWYQVIGAPNDPRGGRAYQEDWRNKRGDDPGYMKHGVKDVDAISETMREKADNDISYGEQYMLGTALVRCEVADEHPWENGTNDRSYQFVVLEAGRIQCTPNEHLGTHVNNPSWYNNEGKYFELFRRDHKFYYQQYMRDLYDPATTYTLQKATIGTVSDNRTCDITEIGLKSKVFKQMSFANVNSKPPEKDLDDIYEGKSSLTLGNVNKYITRYSFFKLQIRRAGVEPTPDWQDVVPNSQVSGHSGLFCVRGSSPEVQYNYIRIDHPQFQYEYRFLPWAGANVIKTVISNNSIKVSLLNANNAISNTGIQSFTSTVNNVVVKFAGDKEFILTKNSISNPEWILGNSDVTDPNDPAYTGSTSLITEDGVVKGLNGNSSYSSNSAAPLLKYTGESQTQWTRFYYGNGSTSVYRAGSSGSYNTVTYQGDNHTLILRGGDSGLLFNLYINTSHDPDNEEQKSGPAWGNIVVGEYNEEDVPNTFGGGKTVTGVEFHYTQQENGLGGKMYPVIDPSIPGSGQDSSDPGYGHPITTDYPKGKPDLYYVRQQETVEVEAPQYTGYPQDVFVLDSNDDDDFGTIKVKLNLWANTSTKQSYAEWSYIAGTGDGDYRDNQGVRLQEIIINPDSYTDRFTALPEQRLTVEVDDYVREVVGDFELNPYDAAADYWLFEGDQASHLEGPEHEIIYCNEIVKDTTSNYKDLGYAALQIDSSNEWTSFSQFSAYFKKGIKVHRLIENSNGATHLFPDIAYALLTDKTLGAGEIINENSVDITEAGNNDSNMTISAKFCKANRYFWDGMISDKVNLREFIFEQATYCLLDFTIIGGKFSLKPSVPYKAGSYEIEPAQAIEIKALFTDGNINELNVSYFAPEDRQTFQANILYRSEKLNGFTEVKSVVVKLDGHENDPVETFDLSGFCTNEQHAKDFGKYVIGAKEKTTHLITFKTAPHYVERLQPGDYIRVYSTTQHTDRFENGAILEGGKVVSKDAITGLNDIYYWNSSKTEVDFAAGVNFNTSSALASFAGSLFTIRKTNKTNQCYKVESITFGDDGLIELAETHTPLISMRKDTNGNYVDDENGQYGRLAILDKWDTEGRFI